MACQAARQLSQDDLVLLLRRPEGLWPIVDLRVAGDALVPAPVAGPPIPAPAGEGLWTLFTWRQALVSQPALGR